MNDPYRKLFESINKALTKLSNMIVWLAKRTLSVKDFMDFVDEFEEKQSNNKIIDELLKDKPHKEASDGQKEL